MGLVRLASKIGSKPKANWEALRRLSPRPQVGIESEVGEDGTITLAAPVARRSGFLGRLAKSMKRDDLKRYELEPIGAFVWSQLDGNRNLEALTTAMRKRFGLGKREAEVSLIAFLQTLDERGLIEMKGPKS